MSNKEIGVIVALIVTLPVYFIVYFNLKKKKVSNKIILTKLGLLLVGSIIAVSLFLIFYRT